MSKIHHMYNVSVAVAMCLFRECVGVWLLPGVVGAVVPDDDDEDAVDRLVVSTLAVSLPIAYASPGNKPSPERRL